MLTRSHAAAVTLLVVLSMPVFCVARQQGTLSREAQSGAGLKRTRLYLKDGSFQVVLSYRVRGDNVFYLSAERGAEEEIIPLKLVDLPATEAWQQRRDAIASGRSAVEIDPELAREEADRAARSPEVAKDLSLPEDDAVLALDTFHGEPQLVPLQQTDGELNRQAAHNILRQTLNPMASAHQLVEIKGETAPAQLHVPDPELFIRLDDDTEEPVHADALRVNTGDNRGERKLEAPSPKSDYVVVRVDVRRGVRVVTTFSIGMLGSARRQGDVIETIRTAMPGGHWLKLTPKEPLSFGEYALVEVLDDRTVNTGVWDFGIRPTAGPNRDAILPEERRPPTLTPRRSQP